MWTYPAYPYLEFGLITLALAIVFSAIAALIGWAFAPTTEG